MLALAFILFGLLAALVSARPAATAPPFQITNTKVYEVRGVNTTIEFTVYDPDPLTNATQKCSHSWKTGSNGYPQGEYAPCGNSSFAWNMVSFTSVQSFVLGIEHVFVDPTVGEYPYNTVTDFGKANVSSPDIWCTAMGGQASCEQHKNSTIKAPVWATI